MIYRTYQIKTLQLNKPHYSLSDTEYQIFKDDVHVCSQPSLEFAKKWIDRELTERDEVCEEIHR